MRDLNTKLSLIFLLGIFLISCQNDQLKTQQTADQSIEFQLSSDFKKDETYPRQNIYQNGAYHLDIKTAPQNPLLEAKFSEYKSGAIPYRSAGYTIEKPKRIDLTDLNIKNENGYDFVAFYGETQDKTALLPTYYGISKVMMKTPNLFITIELKYNARTKNGIKKSEMFAYISPIIQTMEESGNLIY